MNEFTSRVIHQVTLINYVQKKDWLDVRGINDFPMDLLPRLDPEGNMLVRMAFPHNDTGDLRVVALAKVRGTMEPVEVIFTLPEKYSRIIRLMEV